MTKESFNPYEHLSVYHDSDGNPLFENLEDNGKPVSRKGEDGKYHSVLIPKRYLNSNAYREWFRCRYPNGCIEVEDQTQPAQFNGTTFVDSLEYKVKVILFEDRERKMQLASSYGIIRKAYKPDNKSSVFIPEYAENKNTFELAQSIGLRNAMLNAGFIYETSASVLKQEDSQYLNIIVSGPVLDVAPATSEDNIPKVKEPEPSSNEILDYIKGMKTTTEPAKEVEKSTENEVSKEENAKNITFTTLEAASERLKRFNGLLIGDLEPGIISYLSSGNWEGKLSKETIDAIQILA